MSSKLDFIILPKNYYQIIIHVIAPINIVNGLNNQFREEFE